MISVAITTIIGFLRIPLCELGAWFRSRRAVYRATQQGGITKKVVIVVITVMHTKEEAK